jgi:hypothetical protein
VLFTPPGLQSGAAAADGAPTMPRAIPPSRQPALIPATFRRATILLIFMIVLMSFESEMIFSQRLPILGIQSSGGEQSGCSPTTNAEGHRARLGIVR